MGNVFEGRWGYPDYMIHGAVRVKWKGGLHIRKGVGMHETDTFEKRAWTVENFTK